MNFINKVLAPFAPGLVVRRIRSQIAVTLLEKQVRKFEGAGRGRRFPDSGQIGTSTNLQISSALPLLRERSRNLVQNNPYAKNAVKRIANNVVGVGIVATPVSSKKNKKAEKEIKALWKKWAESRECDFDGMNNFYGLEKLSIKTVVKSGSCFARRIWIKKGKKNTTIPLKIQLLTPDFIDHNKTNQYMDNGEYILNGVQFNKEGQRIAYWVFDKNPTEFNAQSRPVPASDIEPVFDMDEPGQVHGIPFFSTVILRMQDFDDYEDAQLMKQKVAACFSAFVQDADFNQATIDSSKSDTNLLDRLEPGGIEYLAPGKTITFASPPATDGFSDYSRQNLQGQAAGIGLSYEAFSGDLKNVNFSSGRMGWLEFQKNVEDWQWNMMVPMFCDPIWRWFVEAANIAGKLDDMEMTAIWTAPRREMIDPVKETLALVKQVRSGFLSWQDAVRQLGYSPEDILAQLKEDKENFDKIGVMPESDPRYDSDRMNKDLQKEADKPKESEKD